jgi:hypothetical protein
LDIVLSRKIFSSIPHERKTQVTKEIPVGGDLFGFLEAWVIIAYCVPF